MQTRLGWVAVPLLTLAMMTGCGDDGDDGGGGGSETDAAEPAMPACSEVWVDGETLPEDYDGCELEDGSIEAAVTVECADRSVFVAYDDRFHATLGGVITEASADSEEYSTAYQECLG